MRGAGRIKSGPCVRETAGGHGESPIDFAIPIHIGNDAPPEPAMTDDEPDARCCPKCCGTDIAPGSVTYSFDPHKPHRPDERAALDLIERKYRCRTCDADFHVVERPNG